MNLVRRQSIVQYRKPRDFACRNGVLDPADRSDLRLFNP